MPGNKPLFKSTNIRGRKRSRTSGLVRRLRQEVNRRLVAWLSTSALQENNNLILNAGSGTAEGASYLAQRLDVRLSVALDIDFESLRIARERDPKISLVRGDLFRLPFKENSFDLVWNNSTIEHLHETRRAIHEMAHVTKRGGRLFLGVPYNGGILFFQSWISRTSLGRSIGNLFDESSLSVQIEGLGLSLEQFTTFFYRAFLGCLARKE